MSVSRARTTEGTARIFIPKSSTKMPLSTVALMCLESSALIKYDLLFYRSKRRATRKQRRLRQRRRATSLLTVTTTTEEVRTPIYSFSRVGFDAKYAYLREHPDEFFKDLNLSVDVFDYILERVKEDLMATRSTFMPPEHKLYMTLRYLAGDLALRPLAKHMCINNITAHKIIHIALDDIWRNLQAIHLQPPSNSEIVNLVKDFHEKWKFPNCVGAIGGKYINTTIGIHKKGIVNIVVDANFRILTVYVERKKSTSESFEKNMFDMSGMQYLPGTEVMLPLVVIGNCAYPLKNNLMKPYAARAAQLCPVKDKFNERLKQARVPVDCAFEILSEKWKIFNKAQVAWRLEQFKLIVKVLCLLYNVIKDREGDRDPHFGRFGHVDNGCIYLNLLKNRSRRHNRASSIAISIRDQMKDYIADH